ncbi:MAG: 4-hydroxythreonine-4-phosphate dehydrogenase PdxA, partial [Luteimonas sp.]
MRRPRLALVPGEPAGVGPELCVRAAQPLRDDCDLIALADPHTLTAAAAALALPLRLIAAD